MLRKSWIICILIVVLTAGCSRIHEPWVRTDQLVQERARSASQMQELQHRLLKVQTDR